MPRDLMADYIPVNERLAAFYKAHPEGSIQSELVELTDTRVVMRALAYRKPDDERPGIGYSSMNIPGSTSFTRGSEVENTETSAWGRAIAALGFEVKRGIATAEEVRNKAAEGPAAARNGHSVREAAPNGGLIGKAEVGKGDADAELRQGPDGMVLCFRLTSKDGGIKVIAQDPLASSLALVKDDFLGQRVTAWGRVSDEAYTANKGKPNERTQTYQVLRLTKLQTADWTLTNEPTPTEAESAPLFDDEEQTTIDTAIGAAV